jgi:hypothetical protein
MRRVKTRFIFLYKQKLKVMYSLKCSYYTKQFSTLEELLKDIVNSGMDPNYVITKDGKSIGSEAIDLIQF